MHTDINYRVNNTDINCLKLCSALLPSFDFLCGNVPYNTFSANTEPSDLREKSTSSILCELTAESQDTKLGPQDTVSQVMHNICWYILDYLITEGTHFYSTAAPMPSVSVQFVEFVLFTSAVTQYTTEISAWLTEKLVTNDEMCHLCTSLNTFPQHKASFLFSELIHDWGRVHTEQVLLKTKLFLYILAFHTCINGI